MFRPPNHPRRPGAGWSVLFVCSVLLGAKVLTACADTETPATSPAPSASNPTELTPSDARGWWPKFRKNEEQTALSDTKPTISDEKPWKFQTEKGIFSSPVVGADGTVFIGSADRTFYAINPDGTLKWKVLTGEIIDSAAYLDKNNRVYFGSGDGLLRARDAQTGKEVWTTPADDPSTTNAFINWFEGNVAAGPDGLLYVPNDNFNVYAIDSSNGEIKWRYKMNDQTWSSPAVDKSGKLFIGNNNLLPSLPNAYCISSSGEAIWAESTLGSVAASPMLIKDPAAMIVGSFDGFLRAYDQKSGDLLWELGTRDHIYSSPAQLSDGTIVQPSADGTIYGVNPSDGSIRWAYDTREPIRSSPAIDADDNIYVGSGDGHLYVLNPNGTLRWAIKLVEGDRNDLNSSPALGPKAVYLGAEDGGVYSVPYDYCLRDDAKNDSNCVTNTNETLSDEGAFLLYTTQWGATLDSPPESIDPNQPIVLSLFVRKAGDTQLAIIDATSVKVETSPQTDVTVDIAGDGKFMTITPVDTFLANTDGKVKITVTADYLTNLDRTGLKLKGGSVGGNTKLVIDAKVAPNDQAPFAPKVPENTGEQSTVWQFSRLALPLPTLMPSYNQIGFDSLHYLAGMVSWDGEKGLAWMIGAKLEEGENKTVVDPTTKLLVPLLVSSKGGYFTFENQDGLKVEVMNATIPFRTFRLATHLDSTGTAPEGVRLSGSTICAEVPFYGIFLQRLGLCNPQTDVLSVYGGALFAPFESGTTTGPKESLGTVTWDLSTDRLVANLSGSKIPLQQHAFGVLIQDAETGAPVTLDYGLITERTADSNGFVTSVTVPFEAGVLPAAIKAYLLVDTYPVHTQTLP